MKIRSITYFCEPGNPIEESRLVSAGKLLAHAREALKDTGYDVQTTRLALPPLEKTFGDDLIDSAVKYAQDIEALCFVHSIDYASLGVARPADPQSYFEIIPEVIGGTQNVSVGAVIASPLGGISLPAIQRAGEIIHRCASLTPDGFSNFRFAALANVEPGVPFLPAAFHEGGQPSFAIATESADLAVSAFAESSSLAEAHSRLVANIEDHGKKISGAAKKASGARSVRFAGIDFSLAPFPSADRSVGAAMEALGVPAVGAAGTVAAAAFITDAINQARFPRVGFSGLFLPVLEDSVLAARASEGLLTLNDLLLYSTVCGTGLDTVPLPGDITAAELSAILLDVAALAMRHNKPLTARLMPMPGKKGGDEIRFDFPYLASGRVLEVKNKTRPLGGALGGNESFDIARLR
ncbi:MAG: DUF711 family protein [Chloroflexi bacterium]|nr:DUF711 family protein [Chloroflexota bacterium]